MHAIILNGSGSGRSVLLVEETGVPVENHKLYHIMLYRMTNENRTKFTILYCKSVEDIIMGKPTVKSDKTVLTSIKRL